MNPDDYVTPEMKAQYTECLRTCDMAFRRVALRQTALAVLLTLASRVGVDGLEDAMLVAMNAFYLREEGMMAASPDVQ